MTGATSQSMLDQISTCWPMINNPVQFVMRYARAIQRYVAAIIRDPHDSEEVAQDFLVKVLDKGFCPENVSRGRFRDYLKSAVRYVAISRLRQRKQSQLSEADLADLTRDDSAAERAWIDEWRECLLERVWQALEVQRTDGCQYYTVLRQYTADPEADSATHAERLSALLGQSIRADAFRQQLRRARRQFAQFVVEEVRKTLQVPTAEALEQELIDLELMPFVQKFLKK